MYSHLLFLFLFVPYVFSCISTSTPEDTTTCANCPLIYSCASPPAGVKVCQPLSATGGTQSVVNTAPNMCNFQVTCPGGSLPWYEDSAGVWTQDLVGPTINNFCMNSSGIWIWNDMVTVIVQVLCGS